MAEYHAMEMSFPATTTFALAIAAVMAVGCRGGEPTDEAPPSPSPQRQEAAGISITDSSGKTVTLPRPASRIASLAPAFTEILFELGCQDRIALRDNWSDYPAAASRIPAVDGLEPSASMIAGYEPDLVLLCFENPRHRKAFARLAIPFAVFEPRSYEEAAGDVVKIGRLCGEEERAAAVSAKMLETRRRVEDAVAGLERPLVYLELDGSDQARPWTAGPGSIMDELVSMAGGRNVAKDAGSRYAQIGAESVVRADPEVVILLDNSAAGSPESAAAALASRPGWSDVKAVRTGRVYAHLDKDALSRPGPRLSDGLEALFEAFHPDAARGRR